jgi:hypothetical protein
MRSKSAIVKMATALGSEEACQNRLAEASDLAEIDRTKNRSRRMPNVHFPGVFSWSLSS